MSHEKVGEVLVAQGNLPEALKSYRDSLAIAERLARADPGDAGWQHDLSVFYEKVGDVLLAQGSLPEALNSYRDRLAIADCLARADPGNADWQRDLSFSLGRVADTLLKLGQKEEARAVPERALAQRRHRPDAERSEVDQRSAVLPGPATPRGRDAVRQRPRS